MSFNPLIGYYHAVDLDPVIEGLNEIDADKLQVSYFKYPYPHRIIEDYFLTHKQYTHLIMIPNDLVYNNSNFQRTKDAIEKHDYPVLSGLCNVDLKTHKTDYNVCFKLPDLAYVNRRYRWLANSTRMELIRRGARFVKVMFAGYPAICIRRDVLDKVRLNFLNDTIKNNSLPIWESRGGFANDLIFCHNINDKGIELICDLKNTMLHFRYEGKSQIGIKEYKVKFIPKGEIINFNVESYTESEIPRLC